MAADSGHQLPAAERAILEQLAAAGSLEPAGSHVHLPDTYQQPLRKHCYNITWVIDRHRPLLALQIGGGSLNTPPPTTSPDPQPPRPFPTKTPPTTTPARPTPATHPATPPLPPPPHPPQARAPLTPPHHHHHNGHQHPRAPHHKRDPNNSVQMTKRITSATGQLSSPSTKSTSKKP